MLVAVGFLVLLGSLVGGSQRAVAAPTVAPVRCPAPGGAIDDARSTAPVRQSRAELEVIRQAIGPTAGSVHDPIMSIGFGRDTLEIRLVPGRERLAAQLVKRYGDALRVQVGGVLYVPRGCGTRPAPYRCPDLEGSAPATRGLTLRVVADTLTIKVGEPGRAHLEVHNIGTSRFAIDSGIPIVGSLVKPGTRHVVGTYAFAIAGTGGGVNLGPGETGSIDMVFGAARCDGAPGSGLAPGRYGLRVVLTPESPLGMHRSPALLSPQTIVYVQR
jgi:hypothetical protein